LQCWRAETIVVHPAAAGQIYCVACLRQAERLLARGTQTDGRHAPEHGSLRYEKRMKYPD